MSLPPNSSCLSKQLALKELFLKAKSEEEKYELIIELGRHVKPLAAAYKTEEAIVRGCQSTVYLHSELKEGSVYFEAESDALISAGLAELLIRTFSGEKPDVILTCPPSFIEEIGISESLTPNRANGLYSIHLRMKQDALKHLVQK